MYEYDWWGDEEWIDFWLPINVRLEISLDLYRATGEYYPDYTEDHILALFPICEN